MRGVEQCGSRLFLRIKGAPSVENESTDNVLDNVEPLITESWCKIPDVVIERTHKTNKEYKDKSVNVPCESIIVNF